MVTIQKHQEGYFTDGYFQYYRHEQALNNDCAIVDLADNNATDLFKF